MFVFAALAAAVLAVIAGSGVMLIVVKLHRVVFPLGLSAVAALFLLYPYRWGTERWFTSFSEQVMHLLYGWLGVLVHWVWVILAPVLKQVSVFSSLTQRWFYSGNASMTYAQVYASLFVVCLTITLALMYLPFARNRKKTDIWKASCDRDGVILSEVEAPDRQAGWGISVSRAKFALKVWVALGAVLLLGALFVFVVEFLLAQ